jgi:hypothetical protein
MCDAGFSPPAQASHPRKLRSRKKKITRTLRSQKRPDSQRSAPPPPMDASRIPWIPPVPMVSIPGRPQSPLALRTSCSCMGDFLLRFDPQFSSITVHRPTRLPTDPPAGQGVTWDLPLGSEFAASWRLETSQSRGARQVWRRRPAGAVVEVLRRGCQARLPVLAPRPRQDRSRPSAPCSARTNASSSARPSTTTPSAPASLFVD